jgi:hypothetical protein
MSRREQVSVTGKPRDLQASATGMRQSAGSGIGTDGAWTPAFEGQRPPFQPGHELSTRHGAYSPRRLRDEADSIAAELRRIVPTGSEADEPSILLLALTLARIEAAHRWLAEQEHGLLRNAKGDPQPILRDLSTWERSAARLCDRLGLTPAWRAELGVDIATIGEIQRQGQRFLVAADTLDLSALSPAQRAEIARLVVDGEGVES